MWRLYLISTIAFSTAAVANDSVREVYYQGLLAPQNVTPTFDKGYLIVYDFDQIDVYRPDGWPMYKVAAHVPNAKSSSIINAAVDTDGTLASAVVYSRGGGIAIFDRTGTQTQFVNTGQYWPAQVCFDADHSIWTLGWQEKKKLDERPEYFILQHYSQDGQKLGAFLPRSLFAHDEFDVEPAVPYVGLWGIRMANNRLGAILCLAQGKTQWMEIDLAGNVLGRWKITGDRHPVAFTASGGLYAREGHGVSVFDRAANKWKPLTGMPDGILLGADGESLVFWMRNTNVLRWMPHPSELPATTKGLHFADGLFGNSLPSAHARRRGKCAFLLERRVTVSSAPFRLPSMTTLELPKSAKPLSGLIEFSTHNIAQQMVNFSG